MRRIDQMSRKFFKLLKWKRLIDNVGEFEYSNGGGCKALSVSKATKDKEGYTGALLIIDEGHEADESTLSFFGPFVADAMRFGIGRIIIIGIGGHRHSLIELMKEKPGWHDIKITPDEILADEPTWGPVFEQWKSEMTPTQYQQHVLCLPVAAGTSFMFEAVPDGSEMDFSEWEPQMYFGIDVGFFDYTIVCVVARLRDQAKVVAFLALEQVTYDDQADQIFRFIDQWYYKHSRICVELNGIGRALHQALEKHIRAISGCTINHDTKAAFIESVQQRFADGSLAVEDRKFRSELEKLTFEVDEWGKISWEHSDYLSALLMVMAVLDD